LVINFLIWYAVPSLHRSGCQAFRGTLMGHGRQDPS